MSGLDELIARLEKATGPDRELDRDIASALRLNSAPALRALHSRREVHHLVNWRLPNGSAVDTFEDEFPAFSESIDAALTLVPDGHSAAMGTMGFVTERVHEWQWPWATIWFPNGALFTVNGKTPALALCIAALKARAPNLPEGEK